MAKGSLLDDAGFESIGRNKGSAKKAGGPSKDTIKLIAAIVLLVAAGVVLSWYYEVGPFGAATKKAQPITQQDIQNQEVQEQYREKRAAEPGMTLGGD